MVQISRGTRGCEIPPPAKGVWGGQEIHKSKSRLKMSTETADCARWGKSGALRRVAKMETGRVISSSGGIIHASGGWGERRPRRRIAADGEISHSPDVGENVD